MDNMLIQGFPGSSVIKNPPANTGDVGFIPRSGRSPGEGNDYPLPYSSKSDGQRSLVGYCPWVCKRGNDLLTKQP